MVGGYKITIEGTYYKSVSGGGKGKELSNYSIEVNLPSMDSALSVIKNKVLNAVLKKKYNDYVSYRTHDIVNVEPFGNIKSVNLSVWQMNRDALEEYILEGKMQVHAYLYPTLLELRRAVSMLEQDPNKFESHQRLVEEDFELTSSIRELNPELYTNAAFKPKSKSKSKSKSKPKPKSKPKTDIDDIL